MRNPYQVLGVPKNSDTKAIKKAYKKLARKYHPDINNDAGADQRFKEINEAWEVLGDTKKRQMYDQFGTTNFRGTQNPGRGPFQSGGRASGFTGGLNMDDILGSIFGTDPGTHRHTGRDFSVTLNLDPILAFKGGTTRLRIQRPHGGTETLTVKIPAGVKKGGALRLSGQGHPPVGGGPCGDLIITLNIADHPMLTRDGKDLEMDLPITIGEGINGAQVRVPTVTGDINVRIPPGSTNGTRLRLKGRGVQSNPPGDLYLILRPQLPSGQSDALKKAIEMLESAYDSDIRKGLKL